MIAATTSTPDHRSLPRQKRPPSERDLAILAAYRTRGCSQADLAGQYGLSQRRISAIIRRVESWFGLSSTCNLKPESCNSDDPHAQLRLDRWLQRHRIQSIYDRALRAHDHAPHELTSTTVHSKASSSPPLFVSPSPPLTSDLRPPTSPPLNPEPRTPGTPWVPSSTWTTTRQIAPSAQFLRVALHASRELGKLAELAPPPPPPSPEKDAHSRELLMHDVLCQLRQEVEEQGLVATSSDYVTTVDQWLDALLGRRPDWINPDDVAPGTPLAELSHFYDTPSEVEAPDWEGEAPAEPSPLQPHHPQPETCNPQPDTDSPLSNCSNCSNSSVANTAAIDPPPPIQHPKSKIKNPDHASTSDHAPDDSDRAFAARIRRRLAHQEKLEQFYEASRRGLPIQLEFDPADGPLPTFSSHVDDYGYQPSPPPTKEEDAELVRAYLEKLRAEQLANSLPGS